MTEHHFRPQKWPTAELTSFVGRRSELDSVRSMVSSSNLVTITGQWAVGKTRLAQRTAAEMSDLFPDGIVSVPLDAASDGALVPDAVATALGLAKTTPLLRYLSDKKLLLLLDSCEHLAPGCARFAASVLEEAPAVRLLTTSRWPLRIPGEQSFVLRPFAVPDVQDISAAADLDAVRLFAARAAASAPGFAVNADNWAQVVQLCRTLDGSPLAIELAVAWLRILPLEDVADRMGDRFSLLSQGNNKFVPVRQRSLFASVTWTYDLCVATEKLLWQRLAVFGDTFDLAAAEVVCDGDGLDRAEIAPTLAQLVEKFVVSVEEGRYRLPQTSREYGLHHLRASAEHRRLAMRHCEYFTQLVCLEEGRWRQGHDQIGALARVRDERSNIFAALEFCSNEESQRTNGLLLAVSLHFYWLSCHGEAAEGSRWLSNVLAQNPEPGRDRALGLVLTAALTAGQAAPGPTSLLEAQGWALVNGDDDLLGRVWFVLAVTLSLQGRLIQALGLAVAANECFTTTGDLASNLLAQSLISEIHTWVGSITAAISTAERALCGEVCRTDDVWAQSYLLLARGTAFARNGDLDSAETDLLRGLHIARRFGDLRSAAQITERLAWTASDSGSHVWAAELLGVSARARRDLGATLVLDIAPIARLRGRYVQRIRDSLGETDYASAFERGVVHEDGIGHALRRGSGPPRRHGGRTAAATPLTGRERQVARLVAEGLTNREVANRLGMAQRTAETHVDRILRKLQLTSRTQLARWLPTSESD